MRVRLRPEAGPESGSAGMEMEAVFRRDPTAPGDQRRFVLHTRPIRAAAAAGNVVFSGAAAASSMAYRDDPFRDARGTAMGVPPALPDETAPASNGEWDEWDAWEI